MGIKFSNNASANIIRALTPTATSVSVTVGKGDLFPSLTEGDYFYATLAGNNGLEIVKVTNRVNDTMTIVRAQDNTTALSFDTGDLFELRIVAADFNDTFSEVNDKLKASIEETTSIVNSAVSSKAPVLHASSSTEYGAGSSEKYGHLKSHDAPDATKTAATGHAFSPAGAAAMQATQVAKDAAQDAAISSKVATVNGLTPDSNGNVDVGGMPLGTLIPYTGKDVPAGTLRADGTTYTNMRSSFPEFYEWVVVSGLTVPLADYALIEGSCGYYGLDTSTGTVRMPTLTAGVFGASVASQYGQAVQAGLPNIEGSFRIAAIGQTTFGLEGETGAFSSNNSVHPLNKKLTGVDAEDVSANRTAVFNASNSSAVYGKSNTVTPSHVKYPWVIVVYNAAVPVSVAQAGAFIELLDGKLDKSGGTMTGAVTCPRFIQKLDNIDITAVTGTSNYGGSFVVYDKNGKAFAQIQSVQWASGNNAVRFILAKKDGSEGGKFVLEQAVDGKFLAYVEGKHIVRSVNGVNADEAGEVSMFPAPDPSYQIALTVNTNHTITTNGFLRIYATGRTEGKYPIIYLFNHDAQVLSYDVTQRDSLRIWFPVKKGDKIKYTLSDASDMVTMVQFWAARY